MYKCGRATTHRWVAFFRLGEGGRGVALALAEMTKIDVSPVFGSFVL